VAAIAGQNDAMAMGAKKAFQEFEREFDGSAHWQELPFLGVDGVPAAGQAWVGMSILSATIVAPALAGTAMDLLVRALRTGEVPPEITFLPPYSFPPLQAIKPKAAKERRGPDMDGAYRHDEGSQNFLACSIACVSRNRAARPPISGEHGCRNPLVNQLAAIPPLN